MSGRSEFTSDFSLQLATVIVYMPPWKNTLGEYRFALMTGHFTHVTPQNPQGCKLSDALNKVGFTQAPFPQVRPLQQ